jgi:hypothetical protein
MKREGARRATLAQVVENCPLYGLLGPVAGGSHHRQHKLGVGGV